MSGRDYAELTEIIETLKLKRAEYKKTWGSRHLEVAEEIRVLEERGKELYWAGIAEQEWQLFKGEAKMLGLL